MPYQTPAFREQIKGFESIKFNFHWSGRGDSNTQGVSAPVSKTGLLPFTELRPELLMKVGFEPTTLLALVHSATSPPVVHRDCLWRQLVVHLRLERRFTLSESAVLPIRRTDKCRYVWLTPGRIYAVSYPSFGCCC